MRWLASAGAATLTDTLSIDCAVPSPSNLLMPSVSRADVVKSGECRLSMTYGSVVKPFGTSFSTVAPLGIRPADGTLTADRITDLIAEAARAQSIATYTGELRQRTERLFVGAFYG